MPESTTTVAGQNSLVQLPALGALWPGQGGYFAGLSRSVDGRTFALIIAPPGCDIEDMAWGPYGKDAPNTGHWTDGAANTQAACDIAGQDFPAAMACAACAHDGHKDWYLPAIGELQLAHMHCKDLFKKDGYYWSSTQGGRYYAWVQYFENGSSCYDGKGYQRLVRPARRLFI